MSMFFWFLLVSIFISHPLIMCVCLVGSSLIMGIMIHQSISLWMMNALVLIFLGGMMILFLYISILSNSEKFTIPWVSVSALGAIAFCVVASFVSSELASIEFMSAPTRGTVMASGDISVLFTLLKTPHILFLVCLLLISLFAVVKLTEVFKGSLVKKS